MAETPLVETPWQTVGPFFHYALPFEGGERLATGATPGTHIIVEGRLLDADGAAVPDGLIEIWQANAAGRYSHPEDSQDKPLDPDFDGFGRTPTDEEGWFRFYTVKPGAVPGRDNAPQAPHICISVMGRGILRRLVTRLYFADEAANAYDPVLGLVPEERRATLIAAPGGDGTTYRLDIRLQGDNETVFFDI
ncbi:MULTISPECIES: protocatechuate 3,4-dioxygenase subunit alpha [Rhodomicrobium]|uniref:protocatechuate 3,4-dioxygenase subunit alpha n=1 Tax=Rhodomicrobium TaxID=1068 RepID=UPI000B4C127F|nr:MULTISPECIES: protocatechuate 3,4-dioxygenase subunit alpha [Rhodomicrobium]